MKHSLQKKILVWSVFIIIGSFLLLLFVGLFSMNKLYLKQKVKELTPIIEKLATEIDMDDPSTWNFDKHGSIVKLYDHNSQLIPGFMDSNIVFDQEVVNIESGLVPIPSDTEIYATISKYIEVVLLGNDVQVIGKIENFTGNSIIIGTPLWENGSVVGALFFLEPSVTYDVFVKGFFNYFVAIMVAFAVIMIMFLSVTISKVIKTIDGMSKVAKQMIQGNYLTSVEDNKYYELEDLANAINELAESLESEKKKTSKLEQYRQEYFSNVAHELKSPLVAIRSRSEVLCDHMIEDQETIDQYNKVILSESIRMQHLIEDMMVLSKLKSDVSVTVSNSIDLVKFFNHLKAKYELLAKERQIEFEIDIEKQDLFINTNERLLEQMLGAIIDNSFKYTPNLGRIKLAIKEEDQVLQICISDTGIGIAEEEITYVFDRYYKADKARSSEGSGLGLAIANELAKKLNAKIWIESEVGVGTEFYVKINQHSDTKGSI